MASDILDADEIWTHLYLTNGPRLIQTLLDVSLHPRHSFLDTGDNTQLITRTVRVVCV